MIEINKEQTWLILVPQENYQWDVREARENISEINIFLMIGFEPIPHTV